MRIYLAARYGRRQELLGCRVQLDAIGHQVTSRWLWEEHGLPPGAPPEAGLKFARDDWEDVLRSECLIAFTEEPGKPTGGRSRGGRHVEFGLGLALKHAREVDRFDNLHPGVPGPDRLIVVGWRENVFHYLPAVEFYESWPEALKELMQREEGSR